MKKVFLSILTLIYMTVSSGFAMEVHYCMGKQAGVDFYNTPNDPCRNCDMKQKKAGCCNDEHRFYKLADAHKNVSNADETPVLKLSILSEPVRFFEVKAFPPATGSFYKQIPPIDSGPALFIRNRVFRL